GSHPRALNFAARGEQREQVVFDQLGVRKRDLLRARGSGFADSHVDVLDAFVQRVELAGRVDQDHLRSTLRRLLYESRDRPALPRATGSNHGAMTAEQLLDCKLHRLIAGNAEMTELQHRASVAVAVRLCRTTGDPGDQTGRSRIDTRAERGKHVDSAKV